MNGLVAAATACATLLLAAAALHDLGVRTVPNALVLALAALGMALAVAQHRLGLSCLVAVAVLLLASLAWARGLMGGGDAKLLFASALLLAPADVPRALLAIALAGGVLALPYLPGRRLFRRPPPGRTARAPAALRALAPLPARPAALRGGDRRRHPARPPAQGLTRCCVSSSSA